MNIVFHLGMFSVIPLIKLNYFQDHLTKMFPWFSLWFTTFTQLSAMSSCISFQLIDICAKALHCIILLITYSYNILINKSN